jgi:hypothetical protein
MLTTRLRAVGSAASPLAGTLVFRGSQFLLLVVIARVSDGEQRVALLLLLGIQAVIGIFSDSGAFNYLLTRDPNLLSRSLFHRLLALQAGLTSTLSIVSLAALYLTGKVTVDSAATAVTALALASTLITDSVTRTAKAPTLVFGREVTYGVVDAVVGVTRAAVCAACLICHSLLPLAVLPVVGIVVVLTVYVLVRDDFAQAPVPGRYIRQTVEIGLSGAITGVYSQALLVFGTIALQPSSAALLAAALRVVQPLEFIPATASAQMIPRIRAEKLRLRDAWLTSILVGTAMAVGLAVAAPFVGNLLRMPEHFESILRILSLAFVIKCGNYVTISYLLARHHVRARLAVSLATAGFAMIAVPIVSQHGLIPLAWTALAVELFLMASSGLAVRRTAQTNV